MIDEARQLASTLLNLVDADLKGKNSAALDLLMGIAIGKISLPEEVLKKTIEETYRMYRGKEHATELLDYIRKNILSESLNSPLPI